MFSKKLWSGVALSAFALSLGGVAYAQSTGSQVQEDEVVVTAARRSIDGAILAETVPKSRASISQEFIGQQNAGQSILNTVNLVPGVNFTNNDAYGSSGGNLRIRGFDGARVSVTFDGVPLNDSGNYAIFSNQMLDPELITRASVNMGTTDVDSPTASAVGGTVNYVTRIPDAEFGVMLQPSFGENNFRRILGVIDSGALGPWETRSFWAGSYTNYDKWKGPGEIEKQQYNVRLYQDLPGDGNFAAFAVHYNQNRNNFYRNINRATYLANPGLENDISCLRPTGVNGVAENEANLSTIVNSAGQTVTNTTCTNYHNLRINPSNTGNIRGQFSYGLTDNLRLTIDPSFQYVLANGGGFTAVSEGDDRLDLGTFPGVDLNGDGDVLDTVSLYTPNTTNTRRWGVTSSLIWDLNDQHRLRFAYTGDYASHRQTGDFGFLDINGNPEDAFGGKDGYGRRVEGVAGAGNLRGRQRHSHANLNQVAAEYRGMFFDDAFTFVAGLRAPYFERELDQQCYSQNASSNVRCTHETPSAVLANGNVQFASTGATQYLPPFAATLEFDDLLPNVGLSWRLSENATLYASYAQGLSAPRTDNVYTVARGATPTSILFTSAQPETTDAYDIGLRYQSGNVIAAAALWQTDYQNRIVSSFDQDIGAFVDRNIGAVDMSGIDAQIGFELFDGFTLYGSASYTRSEVLANTPLGSSPTNVLLTSGAELVETPKSTLSMRADWDITEWLSVGLQSKFVGRRYSTDVNDEVSPAYTVSDFDARLGLNMIGLDNSYLQLNVTNILDERYLGSISSQTNAVTITDTDPGVAGNQTRNGSAPTYSIGAPRTFMLTLRTEF
ncbi:MAG TPA: TonB-dependent receptor [Hyphomonadaceae bacterium]|nr:TonB-dependent receptor [Hyphomonadaceae bacterium]